MEASDHTTKKRLAAALLAVVLAVPLFTQGGCLLPCTACRFLRYLAASQDPGMKASLYEKVVYSLVLASSSRS